MSTSWLPDLAGLGFKMKKTPKFNTLIQTTASGLEARTALMTLTRREWSLPYNYLRSGSPYFEMDALEGFYENQYGPLLSFFYRDQFYNQVTQGFIANGVAPVVVTGTASSGSPLLTVASAIGLNPSQQVSGSGIASGSTVVSISGFVVTLSLNTTGVSGSVTFNTVAYQAQRFLVAGSNETGSGTSYAEPVFCFDQRSSYSYYGYVRSAGLSPQAYVSGTPVSATFNPETGVITLASPSGASGNPITATFSYGFRCRFSEDSIDFDNIMSYWQEMQELKIFQTRV